MLRIYVLNSLVALSKQQRDDGKLTVKPASCLIEGFADEVGWELGFELLASLMRVTPLGKRHRARIVPTVDDFGDALHATAGFERRIVSHGVDVGLMNLKVIRQLRMLLLGLGPDLGAFDAGLRQ